MLKKSDLLPNLVYMAALADSSAVAVDNVYYAAKRHGLEKAYNLCVKRSQ